jgi:hypothetical protein
MKNLKTYEAFLIEYQNFIPKTSIDNPEGQIANVLGEDIDEYMFFQNLRTIKDCVDSILAMNPSEVNSLLRDGHAWAVDHISTSKDDVEEVAGFLKGKLSDSMVEAKTMDFHRILAMTPTWWVAWKKENEDKGYEMKKDAFSKTYEVSKDGKVLFIFDYGRNKIFTNEDPQSFIIDTEISQEELDNIKKNAEKIEKGSAEKDSKKSKNDKEEE